MSSSLRMRLRSSLGLSRTRTAILIAASLVGAVAVSTAGHPPSAVAAAPPLPTDSTVPGGAVYSALDDVRAQLNYPYQLVLGPDGRPWFANGGLPQSIAVDGSLVDHGFDESGSESVFTSTLYSAVNHVMWLPTSGGMAIAGSDDVIHVVATLPGRGIDWTVTGDGRGVRTTFVGGSAFISWVAADGSTSTYPIDVDLANDISHWWAGPGGSLWGSDTHGVLTGWLPDGTSVPMVLPDGASDRAIVPGAHGRLYVTYSLGGQRTLARVESSGTVTPIVAGALWTDVTDDDVLYATVGTDGRTTYHRLSDPAWEPTLPAGFTPTAGRCWQPSTGSLWTAGKYAGDDVPTLLQVTAAGAVDRLHGDWYSINSCKAAPDGSVWSSIGVNWSFSAYFYASADGSVVADSTFGPNSSGPFVVSDDGTAWMPVASPWNNAGIGHLSFARTDRTAGGDRFEGAAKVSAAAFPSGAPVAYLVSGLDFPDALAAGPAAAKQGGPLLLTTGGALPSSTAGELKRLQPSRVVLVGGTTVVAPAVERAVRSLLPSASVEREGGGNRFATGQLVVGSAFTAATHVYVAAGGAFPDALSASAVAGASSNPVVLVDGRSGSLDAETRALIAGLSPSHITVVGGEAAVSAGIMTALNSIATTDRIAGGDRFETSAALARSAFPTAKRVFVASGVMFPDALSGAVWAASVKAPLVTSLPGCLPASTKGFLLDAGTAQVTLLGGVNALAPGLDSLAAC